MKGVFNSFYHVGKRLQILVMLPTEWQIFRPLEVNLIYTCINNFFVWGKNNISIKFTC